MTRSGRVQSAFDIPCNRLLKMTLYARFSDG